MAWTILIISACFEAVWATALGHSNGLREPIPVVVFLVALVISLTGLSRAMRTISVSVAYCVWVSIGAVLTVVVAMASGQEPVSGMRALLIAGVIACVIGLKVSTPEPAQVPGLSSSATRSGGAGGIEHRAGGRPDDRASPRPRR
ncbi:multidrug efflux SMR transporter [Streptomyces sp. NP160]|uniref:DMT family transporter n=1 Tax=Streptomyces sp. NP160 TaxID=2586637 RepID=UPI00111B68DD|nr:multidrug efflux SMR transporter [Streptomyces sp. NP160]TNM61947.1 multidrug efflux SMR transporter [Streptomyces sp. NP160]